MTLTISRTDLARRTREIMERVRRGQAVVVESYGQQEIVLLDVLDYRLLRALASVAAGSQAQKGNKPDFDGVIREYLAEHISLGKAAELLGISRFDLMERFERLGVPLRIGSASLAEARAEAEAARSVPPKTQ